MRIIAFGCSYTYGHGLPDCLADDKITQGPEHSKFSYPAVLAKKINCDYVNLGKSGNSNKEIWHDVLNYNFQKNDVAVIAWTYFSRFCIIKNNSIRRLNPWKDEEKLFFMNYSNRHDMLLDFYNRLNHINFYLNDQGIKNYNYVIEELANPAPLWNRTNILGVFKKIDEADDRCHPGLVSHSTFADTIYSQINI